MYRDWFCLKISTVLVVELNMIAFCQCNLMSQINIFFHRRNPLLEDNKRIQGTQSLQKDIESRNVFFLLGARWISSLLLVHNFYDSKFSIIDVGFLLLNHRSCCDRNDTCTTFSRLIEIEKNKITFEDKISF